MTTLYVDLDGVLADFDAHHETVVGYRSDKLLDNADWKAIESEPMFYATMPLMSDAQELWEHVRPHRPVILTGLPHMQGCGAQKRAWVATYFGEDVPVITCKSREKCLYCQEGDILIDDWERYKDLWVVKGGIWITHRDAKSTIEVLKEMGW